MQLLLGELPIQAGNAVINGSLSYAAQKPWLFSGTVRNNILFGQVYEKKRYNEVKARKFLFSIQSPIHRFLIQKRNTSRLGCKMLCTNNGFRAIA